MDAYRPCSPSHSYLQRAHNGLSHNVAQNNYVEKSGTGVVFIIDIRQHYEYGNKLSEAAGGLHMQMHLPKGPRANEVYPPAIPQFHLAPEITAQPHCTSNLSAPPESAGGISGGKGTLKGAQRRICKDVAAWGDFCGMTELMNDLGGKLSILQMIT